MGIEAMALLAALATTATSIGSSLSADKKRSDLARRARREAEAAAEAGQKEGALAAKRRGRASTLTTPRGGLSEMPTLGRPSLLGAA